jgi:hypothetical protein
LRFFSRDSGFGRLDNGIETLWVGYGNFTEHLAVQLNIGFFATANELTIPYSALLACGTQAYNPEAPEISFAASAVNSRIDSRSYSCFFGQAIHVTCGSAVALYRFEDSFLCPMPCCPFSDSWHISFPLISCFCRLAGGS